MSNWIELFNGRDLEGWTARGPHEWRVAGGVRLTGRHRLLDRTHTCRLVVADGKAVVRR